jgi:hypothetical protein
MSKCKSCAYFECQISALGEYLHPSHPHCIQGHVYIYLCSPLAALNSAARTLGHSLRTHSSSKNEPRNWLVEGNPSLKISLQQPHITGQYHPNNGAARIRPRAHLTLAFYIRVQFADAICTSYVQAANALYSSSRHYARGISH